AADAEEAATLLQDIENKGPKHCHDLRHRPVVFMFPGQGSQYPHMGRDLYIKDAVFHREMDRCFEILDGCGRGDVEQAILGETSGQSALGVNDTGLAQLTLFVVEYAIAKLWMSWGVKPAAMIGHSLGEYTAACLTDVFSLEEGLELIAERARL